MSARVNTKKSAFRPQDRKLAKEIDIYLINRCDYISVTGLANHFGKRKDVILEAIAILSTLCPREYLLKRRNESIKKFLIDPWTKVEELPGVMKMQDPVSASRHIKKHFKLVAQQLTHLKSIGRLKSFLNTRHKDYEAFLADEIMAYIDSQNGKIKNSHEVYDEFKCCPAVLYRVWGKYNGPETMYEYIAYIKIKNARLQFKADPCSVVDFLNRTGWVRLTLENLHVEHYGMTFSKWAGEITRDMPKTRVNGSDMILDKSWLNRIRAVITNDEITIEEVGKTVNLSIRGVRRVINYYAKLPYQEYRTKCVAEYQQNLTGRYYV